MVLLWLSLTCTVFSQHLQVKSVTAIAPRHLDAASRRAAVLRPWGGGRQDGAEVLERGHLVTAGFKHSDLSRILLAVVLE